MMWTNIRHVPTPKLKVPVPIVVPNWWQLITIGLCFLSATFTVAPASGLANCPNSCQCNDDTLVVKCGEGTLDVLPIALNPSIQQLIINNNKIKTIDSSIQFYAELKLFDLSYNDLVAIPQRTFANQRKLLELHLSHNKIGQANNKTFIGLSSLTVLNLRDNLLVELEGGTFMSMGKVVELNLGQNRINRIDLHAFDGMDDLRILYLDDNTLTTVPSMTTFRTMPKLAELFLGTNSFTNVPAYTFKDMKGLTRLDLHGAGLHNILSDSLVGLEGLRYLDISDNRLQNVPTMALQQLACLEELSLGQNDFEVITADAFTGLNNLQRLDVTGAPRLRSVENDAFATNINLKCLNISANKMLSHIGDKALNELPQLRHVVLKENHLSTLAEGLIPWADLQTLDLADNPFVCDCRVLWLRNLLVSKNTSTNNFPPVVCNFPEQLHEALLDQLPSTVLGCSKSDSKQQAVIGVLFVVIASTITALALIIYACRRKIRELLRGEWGNPALVRKEREYQKTFSDEDYITRQHQPCSLIIQPTAPYTGGTYSQTQCTGSQPIPVTEL